MTEQEKSFRDYLSKQTTRKNCVETPLSSGTIENCIRFVSDESPINDFFRETNILSEGQTVLSISDSDTLEKMVQYWLNSDFKKQSNPTNRSAMNRYFKWRGINIKAVNKSSNPPTHSIASYHTPHHNLRLLHIIQYFCGKERGNQDYLYGSFLDAMFYYDESLRHHL